MLSVEDKPEAALAYGRWLLAEGRAEDAAVIAEAALTEGPRFDLYELRALEALNGLEELWRDANRALGVVPLRSGAAIYNAGMRSPDPDWTLVLARIAR